MWKTSITLILALFTLAAVTDASSARTKHRGPAYGQAASSIPGVKTRTDPAHARGVYRNPDRGLAVPCHGGNC